MLQYVGRKNILNFYCTSTFFCVCVIFTFTKNVFVVVLILIHSFMRILNHYLYYFHNFELNNVLHVVILAHLLADQANRFFLRTRLAKSC
jgi:hypothetical protein